MSQTKNKTSSIINPTSDSLSYSFLHKKRHSDSSIDASSTTGTTSPILSKTNSTSSIPKLVRKKSGELVKSNLRLNCLQLGNSKSLPSTPLYNKSVHFGQDVDVRYFNELDKPTAVSANGSPILKGRGFRYRRFGVDEDEGDDSFSDDSDDSDDDDDDYDVTWDMDMINFGKIGYNEKIQVQNSKIFLERVGIEDEFIIGFIAVKNLSFEKNIHIRYTFDNWKTVIEIESFYVNDVPKILKRSNYDRFKFKISLKSFQFMGPKDFNIFFCIRYRFNDKISDEIWDNNDYKNYEIIIKKNEKKRFKLRTNKFLLNDYLTGQNSLNCNLKNDEFINSYFNNYNEILNSPQTPKILKNDSIPSPDFKLKSVNTPMDELNLHDQENKELHHHNHMTSPIHKDQNGEYKKHKHKPLINSKSYQELLDSYCFFKTDDNFSKQKPTTIASYLDSEINKS